MNLHVVYIRGEEIPISEITYEQMCDPAAQFPLGYDFNELPLETQGAAMLAPLEVKRLLGL